LILEVQEVIDDGRRRHAVKRREVGGTGAETRSTKQVLDSGAASCHGLSPEEAPNDTAIPGEWMCERFVGVLTIPVAGRT
jgi:hypothetical protein